MTICLGELVPARFVNCKRECSKMTNLQQGAFHPRDKSLGFHASRDKCPMEKTMCWNDVRKKLPEEDQSVLIASMYDGDEEQFVFQRAYFCDGDFLSLENGNSFPLAAQFWMEIPEIEES